MNREGRRHMRSSRAMLVLGVLLVGPLARTWAESPDELLEKGIYSEETAGDVAAAIQIYTRIANEHDAQRPVVAQALLRLGICQAKLGRSQDAAVTFRRLTAEYPDEKAILARIPVPASPATLPLVTAPWTPDEVLVTRERDRFQVFRVTDVKRDGRAATRLEVCFPVHCQVTHVDPDTLMPMETSTEGVLNRILRKATYSGGSVSLSYEEEGKTTRREFQAAAPVYDLLTLPYLIRRLPLGPGYRVRVPLFSVWHINNGVVEATIEVLGKERVTVPAGTFDAYRVKVDVPSLETSESWYAADGSRYPLRIGERMFELTEIGTVSHAGILTLKGVPIRVSVRLPEGWLTSGQYLGDGPGTRLIAPDIQAYGGFRWMPPDEQRSSTTAAQLVDAHLAPGPVPYYLRGHAPRGTPEPFEHHGRPAVRLVCDYGNDVVHYWAYMVSGEHRVVLWFDLKKERWEKFKPIFDEMIASVTIE